MNSTSFNPAYNLNQNLFQTQVLFDYDTTDNRCAF